MELKSSSAWRFRVAPFPGCRASEGPCVSSAAPGSFSSLCSCFIRAPVRPLTCRSTPAARAVRSPGLVTSCLSAPALHSCCLSTSSRLVLWCHIRNSHEWLSRSFMGFFFLYMMQGMDCLFLNIWISNFSSIIC